MANSKISFSTREEAEKELRRIIDTPHKPWLKRNKKPSRVYEENGLWYLTSKIDVKQF